MTKTPTTELLSVAREMRDYIDALPSDVVASLPTMPGFDRDWADEVIEAVNREAQPVAEVFIRGHLATVLTDDELPIGTKLYTAPPALGVPRVTSIPDAATLTNINQLCPMDSNLSQTDFSTGWNDCRQYALTHEGLPPVIKGVHAAAQGWNDCRAAMLAQPVSQGYKLVPVEPTEEMIAAAMNCDDVEFNSDETFCVNFDNIYRAMLAAAPEGGNG